jgi:uncharacterized protein
MITTRHLRLRLACLTVTSFLVISVFGEKISDIHPQNYLTDLAGVVDSAAAQRINALGAELDQKTGAQLAVVTVKSLEGRPIEDYAVDLFKHLGVGRKDDRGVLLLVAPQERRYRFEVGYGLEPVINDARAGDIGREMVPLLRQNNYSGAIELGANRVAGLIAADRKVTLNHAPPPAAPAEPQSDLPWWALPLGLFILFSIIRVIRRAGRGGRRRGPGAWWIGPMGGWGGGGWGGGGGGFGGSSGGFGGFGGGSSGGGGASGSW